MSSLARLLSRKYAPAHNPLEFSHLLIERERRHLNSTLSLLLPLHHEIESSPELVIMITFDVLSSSVCDTKRSSLFSPQMGGSSEKFTSRSSNVKGWIRKRRKRQLWRDCVITHLPSPFTVILLPFLTLLQTFTRSLQMFLRCLIVVTLPFFSFAVSKFKESESNHVSGALAKRYFSPSSRIPHYITGEIEFWNELGRTHVMQKQKTIPFSQKGECSRINSLLGRSINQVLRTWYSSWEMEWDSRWSLLGGSSTFGAFWRSADLQDNPGSEAQSNVSQWEVVLRTVWFLRSAHGSFFNFFYS